MATKTLDAQELLTLITDASEYGPGQAGVKLEYVNGIPAWEAMPIYRHQKKTLAMQMSLLANAGQDVRACIPVADVTILVPRRFPQAPRYCRLLYEADRSGQSRHRTARSRDRNHQRGLRDEGYCILACRFISRTIFPTSYSSTRKPIAWRTITTDKRRNTIRPSS